MEARQVDAATSPHTSSTPNIFFSILLLPEKSNVKEFSKKYKKEGDLYFIEGKKKVKNEQRRTKSQETIKSQDQVSRCNSKSDCYSICSEADPTPTPTPRTSSRMSMQYYPGNLQISPKSPFNECVECNNNCSVPENCRKNSSSIEVIETSNSQDMVDRRNSELIRQEMQMRDSLRRELIKSLSNEPRYEGCFKKSIPCLITPAAIIFCLLNFFIPGSGTLLSSLSILMFGCETGYGSHKWKRAVLVSFIAALIQFTTCLIVIGWVWSIMWGIDLVMISSNYTCDKENNDAFEEEILEFQDKQKQERYPKETIVIEGDRKKQRRIQFLDTYMTRNRQMEQMV